MIFRHQIIYILIFFITTIHAQTNINIQRGDSCLQVFNYSLAIEYYKKAIDKDKSPTNLYKLCVAYNPNIRKEYLASKAILLNLVNSNISDSLLFAKINLELGDMYRTNYQYDSAKIYLNNAQSIGEKFNYYEPLQKLARLYTYIGNFPEALKYALETSKVAQKNNQEDLLARSYLDLGIIYKSLDKEGKKALYYLNVALKIPNKSLETSSRIYEALSNYYANLGIKKGDEQIYRSALPYMEKAYQSSLLGKDSIGMADNSLSIASLYAGLGDLKKAEAYFNEAGKILLPSDAPSNIGRYYYYYGDFLVSTNTNPKKGLAYFQKAAEIWKNSGAKFMQSKAITGIVNGYEALGNYKLAYQYQKEYQVLNEEIIGEETQKQVQELNIRYETEKKDVQLAQQKVQLLEKQQRITQIALSAALVLLVLIALLAYYRHRQKQKIIKMESEFEQTTQQLESFNYSVSHDLRRPLVNAQISLDSLEKELYKNEEQLNLVAKTKQSILAMNEIVDTMLNLASIEKNKLQFSKVSTNELVEDIIDSFDDHQKSIIFINKLPTINADTRLIRQVFINLISNAIKYSASSPMPHIEIKSECKNGSVEFSIKDNGVGFDEKYSNRLFQLFGRLHHDIYGIGVGLVIVKKIVEKHGGKVWASAQLGKGATFNFEIPN